MTSRSVYDTIGSRSKGKNRSAVGCRSVLQIDLAKPLCQVVLVSQLDECVCRLGGLRCGRPPDTEGRGVYRMDHPGAPGGYDPTARGSRHGGGRDKRSAAGTARPGRACTSGRPVVHDRGKTVAPNATGGVTTAPGDPSNDPAPSVSRVRDLLDSEKKRVYNASSVKLIV